ncbi:MAG: hypothetical protein HC851_21660 [Acaryochloris sp. RU_4_1]|nr:hypothetical protein [Acaryochloris sp. RU_4_1]NJR56663.1 hypothetical protein [Acaryochloris sp. CRU_2_0]
MAFDESFLATLKMMLFCSLCPFPKPGCSNGFSGIGVDLLQPPLPARIALHRSIARDA